MSMAGKLSFSKTGYHTDQLFFLRKGIRINEIVEAMARMDRLARSRETIERFEKSRNIKPKKSKPDYSMCFLVLPHSVPALTLGFLAVAPWLPWRFSLRTLLIATTLVAVMLGIAVYVASRSN
jgi:hypothetical protein